MTSHKNDLLDFQKNLFNIKSRDAQSVASRMCRILQDFPKKYKERVVQRKVTVAGVEQTVEVDRTGDLFDSVWNENVGNCFACVSGVDIDTARNTIFGIYHVADFLIKNQHAIITNASVNFTELDSFFSTSGLVSKAISASDTKSSSTYCRQGFYLDQKTLFADSSARPYDVYEFCKHISQTDFITMISIIQQITESKPWNETSNSSKAKVTNYVDAVGKLTLLTIYMLLDMAHLIDGFSVCATTDASDTSVIRSSKEILDAEDFDPRSDTEFQKITLPAAVEGVNGFTLSKFGTYQMAFYVKYPYRIEFIKNNLVDVEFAPVKAVAPATGDSWDKSLANSYAIYISDKFSYEQDMEIIYKVHRSTTGNPGISGRVLPFIKKIDSYGTITTDTIVATKVVSPKTA